MLFGDSYARPWPKSEPRQQGERCEMSDLLIDQCACRRHMPSEPSGPRPVGEEELDFR